MSDRGKRLSESMKLRGVTKQEALAYALSVNSSTITRWKENGPMSLDHAISLCNELDISIDWFLTGNGSMDQHKTDYNYALSYDACLFDSIKKISSAMKPEAKDLLIALINTIL